MKRTLAVMVLVVSAGVTASRAADSKLSGWISDSMCGAQHAGTGAACAKKCMQGGMGMKPVFVDEGKKAVWAIDNPDTVKNFWGEHVTITATADSDKKSVHIDTIAAAK